jgi:hypothetical protein
VKTRGQGTGPKRSRALHQGRVVGATLALVVQEMECSFSTLTTVIAQHIGHLASVFFWHWVGLEVLVQLSPAVRHVTKRLQTDWAAVV